jgi:tetratricopeptide (TPR) repeat protein
MKNPINFRFLLASLVGFILLGTAVYFLHAFQLHRQAVFMLERARQAKDEKRFQETVRDYQTYLRMAPQDADAHAELGLLLADLRQARPASRSLETALRLAPDREDLRKRLAQLDLLLGRFGDAREHLQRLLKSSSTDDALWEQLGICQAGGGDDRAAVESFQKAIQLDPGRCGRYVIVAALLRRLDRPQEADEWMEKLVAKNPESPQAHFLRARYLRQQNVNQEKAALAEAEKAAALAPADFDILLLAADLLTAAGDYEKARGYADRAITARPMAAGGYRAVSKTESRQGEWEKALATLRRGIEKASDPWDLLWDQGLVLIAQDKLTEAQETVARLRRLPREQTFNPALTDFLQAEIEAAQGHWSVAAKVFAEVARQLERPDQDLGGTAVEGTTAREVLKDAECRLAICCEHLGDSGAQLAAYRKAARLDPLWVPARMGVAATLASLGQIPDALEEYRQIGKLKGATAAADVDIARLLLLKNLGVPESRRDWKDVEAALDRLAVAKPDDSQSTLLRAEALLAQGRGEEAEKLLAAARDKHPESVDLWAALARVAEQRQQSQRAAELLDQAEKKFGDCAWIRLARARHIVMQQVGGRRSEARGRRSEVGGQRSDVGVPSTHPTSDLRPPISDLLKLGAGASKFSAADRLQLHQGLAECLREAGGLEQAKAEAFLACQSDPAGLAARLLLLELTSQSNDTSGMEKVLQEIRTFEGESALWHYGEAVLQAILAERPGASQDPARRFDQAFAHLASAQEQRPSWGRIPLLRARLYDQLGQTDQAIDNYIKAVDAGEIDPAAVRRGFALLYSRQRYAEADAMLHRLEQRDPVLLPELGRLASEVSLRLENADRAVAIARQAAEQSTDWVDHLWLGEVTSFLSQRAEANHRAKEAQDYFREAEKAFRKAVELSPEAPDAWVGLIRFLALTGQKEQAESMLAEAVRKIPADKAPRALAPCYEMLGRVDEAAAQYQRILAGGGDNPLVLRQVAEFCLRTNKPLEAETHLQKILGALGTPGPGHEVSADPQDIAWARRAMASILRARGGYVNLLQAVELIDQNLVAAAPAEDLLEKALLLAAFPQRAKRQEAIELLEKVIGLQKTETADARFALAHLYLRESDWPRSRKQMLALLAGNGKNPRYVAAYVGMLFEHDEMADAGVWLERLEALAPGNPANLVFRVELLVRRQQIDLAIQFLREKLADGAHGVPAGGSRVGEQELLQIVLCLKVSAARAGRRGDRAAKERLLAEMDKLVTDSVTTHPRLQFLGASLRLLQGRTDEALALAEKSWPNTEPALLATEFAEWAGSTNLTQEQAACLDRLLLAAAEKQGRPLAVLQALANLRMRYRPRDAVEVYREILTRDAGNLAALNNLASILALQELDVEESLKLIDRAIAVAGPVAAFLDTRAVALLASGQPQEALTDLNELIRDDPRPDRYFRQALAFRRLGEKNAANGAFREAVKRGLKPEDLAGLERAKYDELVQNLSR